MFHILYLEATRRCNLNCPYCSSGSNKPGLRDKLNTKQIVDRVLIPAAEIGTKFLNFSGGEFLIRKDALQILQISQEMGFRIGIVSNGVLLTDRKLDDLQSILSNNLIITLGINSFDEDNKDTRLVSAEYTMNIINKLKGRGIAINMAVTVGSFNADKLDDTISKIESLGIAYNRIPFSPRNCEEKNLMFTKCLMREKIHPVLSRTHLGYVSYVPFFLKTENYFKLSGQLPDEFPVPLRPSVGCWVGSFYGITPDGEVTPCPLLGDHVSGGNILKTNLKDILFESDLFVKLTHRENLKGKCGVCSFRFTCGGCRTMAYYKTGDLFAEDPTCFIDELNETEINELEELTRKNFRKYYLMSKVGGL